MTSSRKPREATNTPRTSLRANGAMRRTSDADVRHQASGNWNPDWEPFARLDPAWTEKVIAMAIAPAVSGVLDPKTLEFLGIALNAVCGRMHASAVRRHIRRALDLGATKEEITAVLQLASVQGIHSMCLGAPILIEELAANARRAK